MLCLNPMTKKCTALQLGLTIDSLNDIIENWTLIGSLKKLLRVARKRVQLKCCYQIYNYIRFSVNQMLKYCHPR